MELTSEGFEFVKFSGTLDGYYCKELENGTTIIYKSIGDGFYELHKVPDKDGHDIRI